jgi:hypothetical protein
MSDEYCVWQYRTVADACVLNKFSGLEDAFRLRQGVPLLDGFPGDVAFHMDPDFPNNLRLVDNLLNSDRAIVASPALRDWLDKRQIPDVEYLPVSIIDHRGRVASADYVIVHPIGPVDCIDRDQSEFSESRITPGQISRFRKMVIDDRRVPADRQIFRLQGFWGATLVRANLVSDLSEGAFTGLSFLPVSQYPET